MSTADDPRRSAPDGPTAPPGGPGPEARPEEPAAVDGTPAADSPVSRLAATVERLRREVRAAQANADGRALVELAKGVLVERLGCGPVQAAQQLAAIADRAGLTPLELAADIVNEAARDQVSQVAAEFVQRTASPPSGGSGPSAAVRLRTAESGVLAADDTEAMAHALLDNALRPLGACAVAIWTAAGDGSFALSGSAGFTPQEAALWHHVPPGVAILARRALSERRPVFLPSLADTVTPSLGRREWPQGGRMAVPAGTGGRLHGVLEVCWPDPMSPPPPQILRQIEALAQLCAHTLETRPGRGAAGALPYPGTELIDLAEGLSDPVLLLTPHLDAEGRLADFRIRHVNSRFTDPAGRPPAQVRGALLLEAYPLAAEEHGLYERVERVHATGEPFRAGHMRLTALVDQVPLTVVADVSISRHSGVLVLVWRIQDETVRLASLLQHAQRLGRIGGFEESMTTGEITWNSQLFDLYGRPATSAPLSLRDLSALAHPDDTAVIDRLLHTVFEYRRPSSVTFRLQRPDGIIRHIRVIAEPVLDTEQRVTTVRGAYQDISSQHWTEVALHATRDQLAYSEAESEERNRLALQLQHAIMPPSQGPLDLTGLSVAVRYRPAATESLVGGDWYDSVVLPSQQILLCVGDIAGHGIGAATSMVVLRNALRGLAVTGAGPGQLLTWLNLVAHHLDTRVTATVVCGLYDPRTRVLRWARAGHLPPVLIRDRGARTFPLGKGLLLGAVAEVSYSEQEMQLEEGDTLLMYSDGLVERKDLALNDALSHLLSAAGGPDRPLERLLDDLLAHSRSDTDDDTCLIGIHVT
ncbi:GAF domain-containing SpoIIE family protein phosphatase [Streptomyces uncialis]|uniref:GAF domain-containing SpoIIE family protein phosphatase n=1 Tax=Streptomyces uncialis TaxID=1048205 RepID=UPI00386A4BE1